MWRGRWRSIDWIRDNINGRRSYTPTVSHSPSSSEPAFSHPVYKVSVVRLGVADFEAHGQRVLALKLKDDAQRQRFAVLRDYLVQEKIRVKLADSVRSEVIKADTPVDDLFMLDYFEWKAANQEQHYRQMIEQTGVKAFAQWYG